MWLDDVAAAATVTIKTLKLQGKLAAQKIGIITTIL